MAGPDAPPIKGRGATFNIANRYRRDAREAFDDGWLNDDPDAPGPARPRTIVTIQPARTILAHNDSPDVPFNQSINPYQGCEHGCIYCFARPTHAYHDLSPGLDFETKILAKPNAAALLRKELAKPGYRCDPIALGTNTDPYQPVEREWQVTRSILAVLAECEHPFTIVTKSAMVERDIDIIAPMAAKNMARVAISITTLDRDLARKLEPRAALPRLARDALPAARRPRDEHRQPAARRARLRFAVRHAHARHRRVRQPDREALRARVPPLRPQRLRRERRPLARTPARRPRHVALSSAARG